MSQQVYMGETDETSYIKLSTGDMPLIVEAINNDADRLRLVFGCKALRRILSTVDQAQISQIIHSYGKGLSKRLVHLLGYTSMRNMVIEVLWSLVNLTSVRSTEIADDMVEHGIVEVLINFLDEKMSL